MTPIDVDWKKAPPPNGQDKEFIDYLVSLPSGTFWNEGSYEKLDNRGKYLRSLQVTFWLRLLEAFKSSNEKLAADMLKFNSFTSDSLNPDLEKGLKQMMDYRQTGSLSGDTSLSVQSKEKEEKKKSLEQSLKTNISGPFFFQQLNTLAESRPDEHGKVALPKDVEALLKSKEAFAAAFLAAGWLEAALQLHQLEVFPDAFPEWVAYGMTQALRINRSPAEALRFAVKQKNTPPLSVLMGEIYLADKKFDEGLAVLTPYLNDQTDLGYRAAWIASLIYVEKKDYTKAKETIDAQPKLAQDPLGVEGLARIALLQGNEKQAARLYESIAEQSPEALSFLARKAYAEKNLPLAEELTQRLVIMLPDNVVIRQNLEQIKEEARKLAPAAEGDALKSRDSAPKR
jgi:hypothetical protein